MSTSLVAREGEGEQSVNPLVPVTNSEQQSDMFLEGALGRLSRIVAFPHRC